MTSSAIILAAGFGKRMLPITNTVPKPLVEIRGQPLIKHLIDLLEFMDFKKICVNVHYKSNLLIDYLKSLNSEKIIISDESNELLDTGGGIKAAFELLNDESSFVFNSDIFWDRIYADQLNEMLKTFNIKNMDALLGLSSINQIKGYDGDGDFIFQNDTLIKRFKNADSIPYVFSGVQIIKKDLLSLIERKVFSVNVAWDIAINLNTLYGFRFENNFQHVGTPNMVKNMNNE